MARSRNIKPGFFKNYELADCGPVAQLLFAGLWCLADREGRLEDKPRFIKAEVFPYYDADINGELTVIAQLNFIRRYSNGGVNVIEIINFKKHQAPHHTEKASVLPSWEDGESVSSCFVSTPEISGELTVKQPLINGAITVDIPLIPDSLIPDSLIPDKTLVAPAPDFINAESWAEWIEYRKQAKKKMTPATVVKQHLFLANYDKPTQAIIINQSITNGWAGLFEPKEHGNGHTKNGTGKPINQGRLSPGDRTRQLREQRRREQSGC